MKQENGRYKHVDLRSVHQVGLDDFSREVLGEVRPVLLLCLSKDPSFFSQMSEIDKIQSEYGRFLKVCLLEEDFLSVFMERYQVKGTPTFLIFSSGKEQERLLGRVDHQDLARFILQTLPDLNPPVE
ncbi:MAG: thioredoxin family protein [bacterium]